MLGEETQDAAYALELLERAGGNALTDPMPHADAFDILTGISEAIPMSITHDIEEFDMQRGRVKINGVVPTTADAQKVASGVKRIRCVEAVKMGKITQVINSDRQKYVLEFEVKCPEDAGKGGKKKQREKTGETAGGGDKK